jgi:hypothetical protein
MAAPQISGGAALLIERNPGVQLVELFAEIDDLQMRLPRWPGFPAYLDRPPFHPEFMDELAYRLARHLRDFM